MSDISMTKHSIALVAGVILSGAAWFPTQAQQAPHEQHNAGQPSQPSQQSIAAPPSAAIPDLLKGIAGRPALTKQYFEDLAIKNNPTLMQADAIARRSAGQMRQAGLFPNPTAGYQGEQIRGGSQGGGEQGGFLQQTIPLGGKLGLRRDVFEQQQRADAIGVEVQRRRILGSVDQAFYAALAAQEAVAVRGNMLQLARDAVQTAHQLANVGQADSPDVLQSEVEFEQAGVDDQSAQLAFIHLFHVLSAFAGEPSVPLARLAGDFFAFPQVDTDHVVEAMLKGSPAVKRADQEAAAAQAALKSARREAIPDLQLRAGVQQNFEPLPGYAGPAIGAQAFATAGIALPIFNRNQGNVQAAAADLERAHLEASRTRLMIQETAQPLIQSYLARRNQALRYRDEILPQARQAYMLYLARYRQMGSAYPQVIVSQRTLFQLQIGYIQALAELWSDSVQFNNFLLSGGLEAPMKAGPSASTVNLPSSATGGAGQ